MVMSFRILTWAFAFLAVAVAVADSSLGLLGRAPSPSPSPLAPQGSGAGCNEEFLTWATVNYGPLGCAEAFNAIDLPLGCNSSVSRYDLYGVFCASDCWAGSLEGGYTSFDFF